MELADVIDLEAQLALDEGADAAALHARDRAIYRELSPPPEADGPLLGAWLQALRDQTGAPRLGDQVALGHRALRYLLGTLALLSGFGTGELLLHFEEGGSPINIGYFLLTVVVSQLALLLLLGLSLLLGRALRHVPVLGDLQALLRFGARKLEAWLWRNDPHGTAPAAQRLTASYARVRSRARLYGRLERALLLSESQLFGVVFNVGVLASCIKLILFSDLAFGWSTSLGGLDAGGVQRLCDALALPFRELWPAAVPDRHLIEQTQYFRLEGRFAGAAPGERGDATLVGQWWRFLLACTVTYGLLPRVALLTLFRFQLARAERAVPLDTPDVQRVLRRLRTPTVQTQARELSPQRAQAPRQVSTPPEPPNAAETTALVLYRDLPTDPAVLQRCIARDLGLQASAIHHAGGVDAAADLSLRDVLGQQAAPVTVVLEAWEAPDRGLREFLAGLRETLGPRIPLRVALTGEADAHGFQPADPADVRVFRDRLTLLSDPYLAIEVLTPPTGTAQQTPAETA